MPRIVYAGRRGPKLSADAGSFVATAASGSAVATLSNPFAGATSYAAVGTVPAQLALSGGAIVKGSGTAIAGTAYALKVRATSADAAREIAETIGFTAVAAIGTGGGGTTTALPLYARSVWLGDSIVSQAVGSFMKSMQLRTVGRSGGRMILTEAGDKGIPSTRLTQPSASGGGVDDSILSRVPHVAEQKPDIVFVEGGHNDAPGSAGTVANIVAWQRQIHGALRAALPNAYIVWQTVLPSAIEGNDATALGNLASVNSDRLALNGGDGGRTIVVDVSTGFDYPTMTQSVDGIHCNSKGARFVAQQLDAAIASLYPATTIAMVLGETGAQNGHGLNLVTASKYALAGTGGTTANSGGGGVTGSVPDGFVVTNTTSAAVAVTLDTSNAGYAVVQLDITGSVSTEGYVGFGDQTTAKTALSAVPGEWFEALWGNSLTATAGSGAPVGVRSMGAVLPLSTPGYSLGNYLNADGNAGPNVDTAHAAGVARTYAKPASIATIAVQNGYGVRLAAGTVDVRLRLWLPIVRRTFLTALYAPLYVGGDGIKGPAEQIGWQAGTVANDNTLTFRPGAWAGGGIGFAGARIYKGGTPGGAVNGASYGGGAGLGTGTLLATLAAGSWTWTAAGLTSGDSLYLEVDASNALGTATARSPAIAAP